jgi:hypothetical protein
MINEILVVKGTEADADGLVEILLLDLDDDEASAQ